MVRRALNGPGPRWQRELAWCARVEAALVAPAGVAWWAEFEEPLRRAAQAARDGTPSQGFLTALLWVVRLASPPHRRAREVAVALLVAAGNEEPSPSVGVPRSAHPAARVSQERDGHVALLREALPLGAVLEALTDPSRTA